MHDALLRRLLAKHQGHEVTTEGDAFIVAFHTPALALRWCFEVQVALAHVPWPEELHRTVQARRQLLPSRADPLPADPLPAMGAGSSQAPRLLPLPASTTKAAAAAATVAASPVTRRALRFTDAPPRTAEEAALAIAAVSAASGVAKDGLGCATAGCTSPVYYVQVLHLATYS